GNEAAPLARQAILDLGRDDAIILAVDEPRLGECLQLAAEDAGRHRLRPFPAAQQAGADLAVAQRAVLEVPDGAQLVLAADHLLERRNGTGAARGGACRHHRPTWRSPA